MSQNKKSEHLRQIAYMSVEAMPYSYLDLQGMLSDFRKHNQAHGITGLLLHRNQGFFQIFEGPDSEASTLWENIQKDNRHVLVTEISNRHVEKRLCGQWRMAFEQLKSNTDHQPEGFIDVEDIGACVAAIQDEKLAELVKRFISNL